ncbi:MAG: cytochrome c maturation protein CcmE [Rhodobacteraceae bacterium]|nr:cytochrome c maturation protein CcmE [Paracoccaceae bacterium]
MAGLRKKHRIRMVVLGLTMLSVATILAGIGLSSKIQLYRSPSEVMADLPNEDEMFKMGGLVVEGSWKKGETHIFIITDTANDISVAFNGIMPDLFSEGQGTIVTGKLVDGVFIASDVLAKHDETYMPSEVVDTLKAQGVYVEPES